MNKIQIALIAGAIMCSTAVLAQDSGAEGPAAATTSATAPTAPTTETAAAGPADGPSTPDSTPKQLPPEGHLGIAATLAGILKWLLDQLKKPAVRDLIGKYMPSEYIPLISLGIGVVAAFTTKFVGGQPWWMALVYGAVPAGAVFVDQLTRTRARVKQRVANEARAKTMSDDELAKAVEVRTSRLDVQATGLGEMTDSELEAAFKERAARA